jgi:hypothetical protein
MPRNLNEIVRSWIKDVQVNRFFRLEAIKYSLHLRFKPKINGAPHFPYHLQEQSLRSRVCLNFVAF